MSSVLPSRTVRPVRVGRHVGAPRATRAAGIAVALALGLTGCGAGLRAQTYQERATSDSTNDAIWALAIRHLRVLPPAAGQTLAVGGDARVGLVVVNEGADADRLTTVTSDAASSVEVLGPDGRPGSLTAPPGTATSGYVLVLHGLTRRLSPGQYVQLELAFATNGSRTMLVPVEVTGTPGPRREGYKVDETDSSGEVVVEGGGKQAPGAEPPDVVSDPLGDENGGRGATAAPPAG